MDKHHKVVAHLQLNDVVVRTMSYVGISLESNQLLEEKSFGLKKLPVHQLIWNLKQFITTPDLAEAKMSFLSQLTPSVHETITSY